LQLLFFWFASSRIERKCSACGSYCSNSLHAKANKTQVRNELPGYFCFCLEPFRLAIGLCAALPAVLEGVLALPVRLFDLAA
jgi:hypothetical protein